MEKLKVGDIYTENVHFTQEDVNTFARISGDNNPIHLDKEYAEQTPFGRPVIHGMFAAAVFSKVFGTVFPGEGTIYMYQDLFFLTPVFVDELYVVKLEITEVNEERHRGVIKCLLENADGKICIEGKAKLQNKMRL